MHPSVEKRGVDMHNIRGATPVTRSETMLGKVQSSVLVYVWHIALGGADTRASISGALVMITMVIITSMIIGSHDHTTRGRWATAMTRTKGSSASPEKAPIRDRPRDKVLRIRGPNHGTESNMVAERW